MEKLNVLLVEDDPLARQLIEMFIEKSERYAFAGAITSALMTEAYLCKHKIDLILMDVCTAMNANGIDAAEKIKKNFEARPNSVYRGILFSATGRIEYIS